MDDYQIDIDSFNRLSIKFNNKPYVRFDDELLMLLSYKSNSDDDVTLSLAVLLANDSIVRSMVELKKRIAKAKKYRHASVGGRLLFDFVFNVSDTESVRIKVNSIISLRRAENRNYTYEDYYIEGIDVKEYPIKEPKNKLIELTKIKTFKTLKAKKVNVDD